MAAAEIKSTSDQKKLIWAIGLGVVAVIAMWWTFIGFGSSSKPATRSTASGGSASPSPVRGGNQRPVQQTNPVIDVREATEVSSQISLPEVPEPRRNIFAYYEKPLPPVPTPPPPTPPPPPPWLLTSISPANVYAKTEDFSLEARGDKFTPEASIIIDGRPFPTRFVSAQQVSTMVPATLILNPGQRQILVRSSSDATLASNTLILTIAAPPTPNYTYVGIIGKPRNIGDTALLQDKSNKEILSIQRGDVLGGRFRVLSISDRELVVVDTTLKIKHTIQYTNEADKGTYPVGRPTPKVQSEDDEP